MRPTAPLGSRRALLQIFCSVGLVGRERGHGQLAVRRVDNQFQSTHVAPIRHADARPFFHIGVVDGEVARRARPRHISLLN